MFWKIYAPLLKYVIFELIEGIVPTSVNLSTIETMHPVLFKSRSSSLPGNTRTLTGERESIIL